MNAVVFEHVPIGDLPAAWRAKLTAAAFAHTTQVTVRIEEDQSTAPLRQPLLGTMTANPMFGMWRDRQDMADVPAYVRRLRTSRLSAGIANQAGSGSDAD